MTLARTAVASAAYVVLAIVMTWPVAWYIDSRLAADLGDPLLNCWVLAWTAGELLKVISGDVSAVSNFWNANIFYPEPLTLAYSEHLAAQAIQVLPVQALTGNILLSYNLLFISTFALSGIAVYLLVEDLTGSPYAAFLAGLAFAYAPYRMGQLSHLQVLSSYWMAFALVGFHRYFVRIAADGAKTAALRGLAGGAVATVMQNLSNGYFMLFFAPFVVAYCLYEVVQRRLLGRPDVWLHLLLAAAFIGAATWPFVWGYLELRQVSDLGVRSMRDLIAFSADTYSFATPPGATRWLKSVVTGFPKPEGTGFPGFTILAFAAGGVAWGTARLIRDVRPVPLPHWHLIALSVSGLTFLISSAVVLWFFINGTLTITIGGRTLIYYAAQRECAIAAISFVTTAALVSLARRRGARARPSNAAFGFFAVAALAAAVLALGPEIQAWGRQISPGPYQWLFDYVPGYDGLRVPARFLMLVTLFMAVLAGLGAWRLLARGTRLATGLVALGMAGILIEGNAAPIPVNAAGMPRRGLVKPQPPVVGDDVSQIYEFIRSSPEPIALLELPFGDRAYDLLAVFYAGHHRKPIANGYSGMFPRTYRRNASALRDIISNPDRARRALGRSGATHVLVHERAWPNGGGRQISAWLSSLGARPVMSIGTDRLFVMP